MAGQPDQTEFGGTKLDWAVIALLERVQTHVVNPIIARWLKALRDNKLLLAKQDDEQQPWRLARNIAAGLLCVDDEVKLLPGEIQKAVERVYECGNDDNDIQVVIDQLEENGHWLFNAYYYVLTSAFGEESLVPIVPGYHRHDRSERSQVLMGLHSPCETPIPFDSQVRRNVLVASASLACWYHALSLPTVR